MKVVTATGVYGNEKQVMDVVISNVRREVSQKGMQMYVLNCDIILAKSKSETVVDRRVLYKTGKQKPK